MSTIAWSPPYRAWKCEVGVREDEIGAQIGKPVVMKGVAVLAWLAWLGWTVLHGPGIAFDIPATEPGDYGEVVLAQRAARPACSSPARSG